VPDFSKPENIRKVGPGRGRGRERGRHRAHQQIHGHSSLLWAEPLAAAGLLAKGESIVAFCDYDYPADDPVYAMGPLAGAKSSSARR
jgi:enoyl-[acyl-carrier protein] reductase/trans-2-enoyl-CoA reductase (NAD+)